MLQGESPQTLRLGQGQDRYLYLTQAQGGEGGAVLEEDIDPIPFLLARAVKVLRLKLALRPGMLESIIRVTLLSPLYSPALWINAE